MKPLLWVGVVLLVLGIASLFIPIPHTETEGVDAGNQHLGVQVEHKERVSPIISAALILGGVGLMIVAKRK